MDIKIFAKEVFETFFVIFACSVVGYIVYIHLLGAELAPLHDLVAILVMSILATLAGFILYSRKEQKLEMLVRHALHLLAIVGIALGAASYMGWIVWYAPMTVFRFLGLIVGIYIVTTVIIFYNSKKLADDLTQKLKERYK